MKKKIIMHYLSLKWSRECIKFNINSFITIIIKVWTTFASLLRTLCFRGNKNRDITFSVLRIVWNVEKWDFYLVSGCMCVRVYLIFNFLNHYYCINGLRYRIESWYTSEAVISLYSLRISCKLMPNLRFHEIFDLTNVWVTSNFCKIWDIVLKLHTNIIYRYYGTIFRWNRLKRLDFSTFWICWNVLQTV